MDTQRWVESFVCLNVGSGQNKGTYTMPGFLLVCPKSANPKTVASKKVYERLIPHVGLHCETKHRGRLVVGLTFPISMGQHATLSGALTIIWFPQIRVPRRFQKQEESHLHKLLRLSSPNPQRGFNTRGRCTLDAESMTFAPALTTLAY